MLKLENITENAVIKGILSIDLVTVVKVKWFGDSCIELTFKKPTGDVDNRLLYREDEPRLEIVETGKPWSFNGDGSSFRLVSEAMRINLAHLFDPILAVHTSIIDPLPHQITAVYEHMIPRQPLRFLLADDPGAGKTIMAGLFIKELIARGDLQRCLVVCPGSLAEQWQDELYKKFNLKFQILTNDKLESAASGNWLLEEDLVIARLDKLSRDEALQAKLKAPECDWDLVVCDEAHKMSATVFGNETKYTKRYRLGQLLSGLTRHFLLMTATPHNGKEADFQLFMALLDGDRFEGRYRDGVHVTDASDLMRRMVKENLLKFDGKPLFPERIAYTVPFLLSDPEAKLYGNVTEYVREQFNRADALQNNKRAGTVGFALTILQRRLASSPEAIFRSLERRRKRLEKKLREMQILHRSAKLQEHEDSESYLNFYEDDDYDEFDDLPENELDQFEEEVLDQATASRTIDELKSEIEILKELESNAYWVRNSGTDTKWTQLSTLIDELFSEKPYQGSVGEAQGDYGAKEIPKPKPSTKQKLVIFTEHRDTINYLFEKITTLIGKPDAVKQIHGGLGREERLKAQESFKHDPHVRILLATDAAGEGINLQRAHLMVNYDLPWNPNRIEQRFGRIHRIGQVEVCHLWNLVAKETREGDVYHRLLEKLATARERLGGQVFDVLGKLQFGDYTLRKLLIEAIRYGDQPEKRAKLEKAVEGATDPEHLRLLMEEKALAVDNMDTTRVNRVREEMERAEARRLQPHYIESYFKEAFSRLGGTLKQREAGRYQITHVPAQVRNRDRLIGLGEPILPRYERIAFEKEHLTLPGKPLAAFISPGHPLLASVTDITLEQYRDLMKQGAILVDENDYSTVPKVVFYLEHAIQDGVKLTDQRTRTISKRLLFVSMDSQRKISHLHYAPYLDYRPLRKDDPDVIKILDRDECAWISADLENEAINYAALKVVPEHVKEVKKRKMTLIDKTEKEVKNRLTKEINYWDHRAEVLRAEEEAGKSKSKLNSNEARRRADVLQGRLRKRLEELNLERQISPKPPTVIGGLLVVPVGLLNQINGVKADSQTDTIDNLEVADKAREIIIETERELGFEPVDKENDKLGYDIESRVPGTGKLRFIEVKGRSANAKTITVTKNEVLYSLNKPEDYILAIVEFFDKESYKVYYVREPFQNEPDFNANSVNYDMAALLAKGEQPS
jgi:superfamily II DNA or RNA helicase